MKRNELWGLIPSVNKHRAPIQCGSSCSMLTYHETDALENSSNMSNNNDMNEEETALEMECDIFVQRHNAQ